MVFAPLRRPLLVLAPLALWTLASCDHTPAPRPPRRLPSGVVIQEYHGGFGAIAAEGAWIAIDYDARIVPSDPNAPRNAPFDSTRRAEPFVFHVGRTKVIPGLDEGVRGLRLGGRRVLTIPPSAAYGATGKPPVPPDATLEYDVTLSRVFAPTDSGLWVLERHEGTGPNPKAGQRVAIRCRVTTVEGGRSLLDPKQRGEFDVEVGAGTLIPALEEVLPKMRTGASWRLGVSPDLGYGATGRIPFLAPDQDVLIDVDLLKILPRQ